MNKYLTKAMKWGGLSMFGFSMFVAGQVNQAITASESVTAHFVSEWVALDKDNGQVLQRYESICNKPIGDSKAFKESIESPPVTHKECAEQANAAELYAVIQKANSIVNLSWPLNAL